MTDISRTEVFPYSTSQMFGLVNAIEDYPEFLPWCVNSHVLHRDDDEVKASLVVSGAGLSKSFTTHNRLQKDKMIEIRLIDGPFKHLEGFWRFDHVGEGCRVALDLEFEFAGGLLNFAFGPVFHQMANSLVDAFGERAKAVYGEHPSQAESISDAS